MHKIPATFSVPKLHRPIAGIDMCILVYIPYEEGNILFYGKIYLNSYLVIFCPLWTNYDPPLHFPWPLWYI